MRQLGLLALTAAGTAGITGLMRERLLDAFATERRNHATAARLSAALDQVDIGIVLLDAETRAEFINRAFRDYFALPDEKADDKPPFIALMYHGRDTGAFELPEDELGIFIAQRMEMVRIGDATPINITLRNGEVLRFVCAALPDGGRMLSYTPVTDLVRHTDAPVARRLLPLAARSHGAQADPVSARCGVIATARLINTPFITYEGHFIDRGISQMSLTIRSVTRQDYDQWLPLWDGYNAFYGRSGPTALAPEITR